MTQPTPAVELVEAASPGDLAKQWARVNPAAALDRSLEYLAYRASTEPGASFVACVRDDTGLSAAAAATISEPASALFSNPWKMLSDDQLFRLDAVPNSLASVSRREELTIQMLCLSGNGSTDGPVAGQLHAALGPAIVVRSFDSSEVWMSDESPVGDTTSLRALRAILSHLQAMVDHGLAGAVSFPFVDPADAVLRDELRRAGFVSGVVTASSTYCVPEVESFDELLAKLTARRRKRFRNELAELEGAGLTLTEVSLTDHLERVAALEVSTMRAHGGGIEVSSLVELRRQLLDRLSAHVRVPAALDGETIVACGVDLFDDHNYYGLTYGADPLRIERGTAYMCVGYYEPLMFAIRQKISNVHFGFEAFIPKLLRGATVTPREMWVWTPNRDLSQCLGDLLGLYDARTMDYLRSLGATSPAGES